MRFLAITIIATEFGELERSSERERSSVLTPRILTRRAPIVVVLVVLSLVIPYFDATRTAFSIKNGEKPEVEVRYLSSSGSADQVTVPGLVFIGATQRAAFFYDANDKDNEKDNHTLVIPQSQIVSIEVPD